MWKYENSLYSFSNCISIRLTAGVLDLEGIMTLLPLFSGNESVIGRFHICCKNMVKFFFATRYHNLSLSSSASVKGVQ